MIHPTVVWALCSPENQARWRARAMRLSVHYAHHWDTDPDTVARLMPTDTGHCHVVLAALAEALDELATRPIHGVTDADVWDLVEQRAVTVPAGVRSAVLTVLRRCVALDAAPTRFAATAIDTGMDPAVAGHVAAMIVGVLAVQLDLVRHLNDRARDLDPPNEGHAIVE